MASRKVRNASAKNGAVIEKIRDVWPELKIKLSYFEQPTETFVYNFYNTFYRDYQNLLRERKLQLGMEDPGKYVDLDPISLAIRLKAMSRTVGLLEFSLLDMVEPTKNRSLAFFGLFANFFIFARDDNADDIGKLCDLKQKNAAIKAELREFEEEKTKKLISVGTLRTDNDRIRHEIDKASKTLEEMRRLKMEDEPELEEMRDEIADLRNFLEKIEKNMNILKEEKSELDSKMRIEAQIEEMSAEIARVVEKYDEMKSGRANLIEGLGAQKERMIKIRKYIKDLEEIAEDILADVEEFLAKYNKQKKSLEWSENEKCKIEKSIEKQLKENGEIREENSQFEQKTSQLRSQIKSKDDELNNLRRKVEEDEKTAHELRRYIELVEVKIDAKRKEIDAIHETVSAKFHEKFLKKKEAVDLFDKFMDAIEKEIEGKDEDDED